jgi:hypothetical protein
MKPKKNKKNNQRKAERGFDHNNKPFIPKAPDLTRKDPQDPNDPDPNSDPNYSYFPNSAYPTGPEE